MDSLISSHQTLVQVTRAFVWFLSFVVTGCLAEWSYYGPTGPPNWADLWPSHCARHKQSPIDIIPSDAAPSNATSLILNGYRENDIPNPAGMEFINNGHTVEVKLIGNFYIMGGPLEATYQSVKAYFHWGTTDDKGSEHTLLGQQYAGEIHILHYDRDNFGSLSDAMEYTYGLAVLAIFIEIGQENPTFEKLVEAISKVKFNGDRYAFSKVFALDGLLPGKDDLDEYFFYEGSLTTPECNEGVQWIVYRKPIQVSQQQIAAFRTIYTNAFSDGSRNRSLVDNFRPTQRLNGRTVYRAKIRSDAFRMNISMLTTFAALLSSFFLFFN